VVFDDLRLAVRLAPYKHTGVFPEQQENWNWARARARARGRPLTVLNLFAYTGGATVALAKDAHFVTHVDASKPAIAWAKENAALNQLGADRVRWILDDAPAFVARERRRGKRYDAIILDPPAFGHSPTGKAWRVERDLAPLLEECCGLLSDDPAFIILNGYTQHDTPQSFHRLLSGILRAKTRFADFNIEAKELHLTAANGRSLSTGIVARCAFKPAD
jgi:23S rRNA (cytosine1962-C5)-methyltransferase